MPRVPGCDAVYEVADQWRERCLIGDGSLLWPDLDEPTWTIENLERAVAGMKGIRESGGSGPSKHGTILKGFDQETDAVRRIVADVLVIWPIMINWIKEATRLYWVTSIARSSPNPQMIELYRQAIATMMGGIDGGSHQTRKISQLQFYLWFAERLKSDGISAWDAERCHALAYSLVPEIPASSQTPNMLLHLLFPDDYEAITIDDHKKKVLRAFGVTPKDQHLIDAQLREIRPQIAEEIGRSDFHYYEDDVLNRWQPDSNGEGDSSVAGKAMSSLDTLDGTLVSMTQLSSLTNLDPSVLSELESLIHSKKQIIFEGPPGSGKTFVARLFARYLAGLPLDGDPDPHVEIVQFHQSYGYEDFVAGIRPVTSEGGTLTYETRPGIFVEMCRRAMAQPDETFVLIIDEINRGNLSRIFGELLYGLEYRDQPVRMQYPVTIDGVEREHLTIPDNLYVIGTMNSTDRSLAMIDYALRRRFYFWRLIPMEGNDAPVLRHWLDRQEEIDPADRQRLLDAFIALNGSIVQLLGEDYQIGHSYFMLNDGMAGDPAAIARVWQHAIEPLLREYFHTRHDSGAHIAKMRSHFVAPPVASLPEFDMDVLDS